MHRRGFLFFASLLPIACTRQAPLPFKSTNLNGANFGRDFALDDPDGRRRSLADFRGKVVVLFFGYASCPDVCPTTLAKLATTMGLLGEAAARVQVIFVTVDPARDTATRLKDFVPWFHPDFLALRGTPEATKAVLSEFRAIAIPRPIEGSMGYVIDHSAGCYVFDPAGKLRLYAPDTLSAQDLAADLRLLLAAA